MPVEINPETFGSIELDELVAYCRTNLDTTDHASMIDAAAMLGKLGNNRDFLGDSLVKELKDYRSLQLGNGYSPQVIMLYFGKENFFVRANIWPSLSDSVVKTSGGEAFFYEYAHDHNFNFITVGYHGPGYWSDYYQYENQSVAGVPGESVGLEFVERSALNQGRTLLYRAFQDVHEQRAPDSLSISLNVMENTLRVACTDQYGFDVGARTVLRHINRTNVPAIMCAAAALRHGDSVDVIAFLSRHHPLPRIRIHALKALAGAESDASTKTEILEAGASDWSSLVKRWSRLEMDVIERSACGLSRGG